MTKRPKS